MRKSMIKVLSSIRNDGFNSIFIKFFRRCKGLFLKLLLVRPSKKDWGKLKNKYSGKTVYLIGNGPSLNISPLYLLKNEYTMVFNRFSLMLDRLNWTPTFYSTTDDLVLENIIDEAINLTSIVNYSFFPDISFRGKVFYKKFPKSSNILWINQKPTLGFSTKLPDVNLGGTTIFEGIQILKYLGFTKIVLVGVDMNYKIHDTAKKIRNAGGSDIVSTKDDDPNHFDTRYFGKGRTYHQPKKHVVDNIFKSLRFLRDYVEKCPEFDIVNASIESKLDYFKMTSLEDELGISDGDKSIIFEELIKSKNGGSVLSFECIHNGEDIEQLEKFKMKVTDCKKLIPKLTMTYTVLGPYQDEIYFLRK